MSDQNQVENILKEIKDLKPLLDGKADSAEMKKSLDNVTTQILDLQKKYNLAKALVKDPVFGDSATRDRFTGAFAKALKGSSAWENANDEAKAIWTDAITKAATNNEVDANAGSTFVQTTVDSFVSKLIPTMGVAFKYPKQRPGLHGALSLNKRTARASFGPTVSGNPSANRGDAGRTANGSTYDKVALTTYACQGLATVDEYLIWHSVVDTVNEAAEDLMESMTYFMDDVMFNGDGTAEYLKYTGFGANASCPKYSVTSASFKADPVAACIRLQATVAAEVLRGGTAKLKYFMHPSTWAYILGTKSQISASMGSGSYVYDPTTGLLKPNIAGYDVEFSQAITSDVETAGKVPVFFGDAEIACSLGQGRQPEIRILMERYAELQQVGVRLTADLGMVSVWDTALAGVEISES